MELARALKSSFLSDMAMKTSQQVFIDDIWCVTGLNNVTNDDFSVDDLLDFSDKDFKDGSLQELHGDDDEKDCSFSGSSQHRNSQVSAFSGMESFGELPLPVDELENLEWLSQFVDDTTSEFSLLCPAGSNTGGISEFRSEPVVRPVVQKMRAPCFPLPVPVKPRTKRSRPAGKIWSYASPTVSADSCSPTSSSYGSSLSFVLANPVQDGELFCSVEKPPSKKPKKNSSAETGSGRRCTHCLVQKTPQWRTGPLGPKTLCNACGVRYKSGRLFPEYRPACSPTFSQEVHSNSHRKVLEMRRMKETSEVVESGLTPMVSTC